MKTIRCLVGLFLILSMSISIGMAGSSHAEIAGFSASVLQKNKETGFLARWGESEIEDYIELLKTFGLYDADRINNERPYWWTVQHGLLYAFERAWGSSLLWSLEQQYQYAEFEMKCGLRDNVIESFPNGDDLAFDAARELAQKTIRDMGEAKNYDGYSIDFNTLIESYHFWEYPLEGRTWVFEYYEIGVNSPTYSASLYFNGTQPQVNYYDAAEMYNIYREWYYSRGFQPFLFWSIDDKYEFYQCLLSRYDRQMERYGVLPEIAQLVLEKKYISKQDGMISENQATNAASESLKKQNQLSDEDIDAMRISISLYENRNGIHVYGIGFGEGNEVLFCVEIDPYSGQYIGMAD